MVITQVDFSGLVPRERYKLLVASVTPRPIALITTLDSEGRVNAAPFSFFNAILDDPPMVAFGVAMVHHGVTKDTARNVDLTGEFVVNLVDEPLAAAMNECAVELPPGESELDYAGLAATPSLKVAPPRIVSAPIALECRRHTTIQVGIGRSVVLGEVVAMSFRADLYDAERNYVAAEKAGLVGRMHGAGWYARTSDLTFIPRATGKAG